MGLIGFAKLIHKLERLQDAIQDLGNELAIWISENPLDFLAICFMFLLMIIGAIWKIRSEKPKVDYDNLLGDEPLRSWNIREGN